MISGKFSAYTGVIKFFSESSLAPTKVVSVCISAALVLTPFSAHSTQPLRVFRTSSAIYPSGESCGIVYCKYFII